MTSNSMSGPYSLALKHCQVILCLLFVCTDHGRMTIFEHRKLGDVERFTAGSAAASICGRVFNIFRV
jgi:hypothetical protein